MTDRELLEFAAKAAGITGFWVDAGINTKSNAEPIVWNPLIDDGNALRLAVKLGLDMCIDTPLEAGAHTHVIGFLDTGLSTVDFIEHHNTDPYAATRRAIVLAAAQIGRSMT